MPPFVRLVVVQHGHMQALMDTHGVDGDMVKIHARLASGEIATSRLLDVNADVLTAARPWRQFRWYRNQRHFSGSYWSATMSASVGYESRLELANLILVDFDPKVTYISSQPFMLEGPDNDRSRRHIPDYLLRRGDASVCVVDVKPFEMLGRPRVNSSLRWSRYILEGRGWEYQVVSEPDPVRLANIRFLAGYRRPFQFIDEEIVAARALLEAPTTIGAAVRAITPIAGDAALARSLVLHLLWRQVLCTDLSVSLQRTSILEPA